MSKTFYASFEQLYAMLEYIQMHIKVIGFSDCTSSKIELAAEEALVNIINHSGLDNNALIEISCSLDESPGIKIMLKDRGAAYNPLLHFAPKINEDVPLEDRPLGGYGIYLIVKLMDEVHYQHHEGCNILTLIKYLA